MGLYENYLKLITNGLQLSKAEFINVIHHWDETIFPGTETSIVGNIRASSGDTENLNEIDAEIERMNDEDQL
jgi:hypothetical protein